MQAPFQYRNRPTVTLPFSAGLWLVRTGCLLRVGRFRARYKEDDGSAGEEDTTTGDIHQEVSTVTVAVCIIRILREGLVSIEYGRIL